MRKEHRFFSKREVVLFCFLLLESLIIIFDIVSRKDVSQNDIIVRDIFTILISVICSVIATAVLPRGVQNNDSEELAEKVSERINKLFEENQYVLPVASYVDTNDPNREFNKRLNDQQNTKLFVFQ